MSSLQQFFKKTADGGLPIAYAQMDIATYYDRLPMLNSFNWLRRHGADNTLATTVLRLQMFSKSLSKRAQSLPTSSTAPEAVSQAADQSVPSAEFQLKHQWLPTATHDPDWVSTSTANACRHSFGWTTSQAWKTMSTT